MSTQLSGKKRGCAAMPSAAEITKGDVSDDASSTESSVLGPDSPTNASGGDPDKQRGALVIPAKAKVGKKKIDETGVAVGGAPNNLAKGKGGQKRELQGEEWWL